MSCQTHVGEWLFAHVLVCGFPVFSDYLNKVITFCLSLRLGPTSTTFLLTRTSKFNHTTLASTDVWLGNGDKMDVNRPRRPSPKYIGKWSKCPRCHWPPLVCRCSARGGFTISWRRHLVRGGLAPALSQVSSAVWPCCISEPWYWLYVCCAEPLSWTWWLSSASLSYVVAFHWNWSTFAPASLLIGFIDSALEKVSASCCDAL